MIIIDNGFRKRGTSSMCNCVFARREGHKSELQGRGTRFLRQAYKNQYERLRVLAICAYLASFFFFFFFYIKPPCNISYKCELQEMV